MLVFYAFVPVFAALKIVCEDDLIVYAAPDESVTAILYAPIAFAEGGEFSYNFDPTPYTDISITGAPGVFDDFTYNVKDGVGDSDQCTVRLSIAEGESVRTSTSAVFGLRECYKEHPSTILMTPRTRLLSSVVATFANGMHHTVYRYACITYSVCVFVASRTQHLNKWAGSPSTRVASLQINYVCVSCFVSDTLHRLQLEYLRGSGH